MVLLADLTAQEVDDTLTGQEIIVDGSVQRLAVHAINPFLMHACRERGMHDVKKECSARL